MGVGEKVEVNRRDKQLYKNEASGRRRSDILHMEFVGTVPAWHIVCWSNSADACERQT